MRKTKSKSVAPAQSEETFTPAQQKACCGVEVVEETTTAQRLWSLSLGLWHMAVHPAEKRDWLKAADYWRDYLAAQD